MLFTTRSQVSSLEASRLIDTTHITSLNYFFSIVLFKGICSTAKISSWAKSHIASSPVRSQAKTCRSHIRRLSNSRPHPILLVRRYKMLHTKIVLH